jgi:ATP-dependent helicase/DNAse subunit B
MADTFAQRFGPAHAWSSSRLEAYRTCPFLFFVGSVLHLEPRAEPAEGLDARQLGSIYHRILEQLYQRVDDPADLEQLLAALPDVARAVLDEAPGREGFRETAWWSQTRAEILEDVRRSLQALARIQGDFIPSQYEAPFGLRAQPVLVVRDGDDSFRLRGLIDRVDRTPDGRLRVIDYKTGGPASYNKKAVTEGKKIQLPLYALAARDALGLGEPVEGFYWHVRHAQPSPFTLSGFDGGPEAAMGIVVEKVWETVREARAGHFMPQPPDNGCPSYCPAAGFCWRYQPGFGG